MLQRRLCAASMLSMVAGGPTCSAGGWKEVSKEWVGSAVLGTCLKVSMGALSMAALARRLGLWRLDDEEFRRLPCRRNCAAAATAAREGATPFFIDADELERGILSPSRFSTGGSSLAAFALRASRWSKVNEATLLGVCSLVSDSSSLESLSKSAGYRSRIDLLGLGSTLLVSVRARPFSSTVRMTEVRCRGRPSDIDPSGGRPCLLTGDAVRGI